MMRPAHPCSSTAATIRGNPFPRGTHTIMTPFPILHLPPRWRRPDRHGRVGYPRTGTAERGGQFESQGYCPGTLAFEPECRTARETSLARAHRILGTELTYIDH